MSFGINVTMLISAACYLLLIPTSLALLGFRTHAAGQDAFQLPPARIVASEP
jgi:hypothetical protein